MSKSNFAYIFIISLLAAGLFLGAVAVQAHDHAPGSQRPGGNSSGGSSSGGSGGGGTPGGGTQAGIGAHGGYTSGGWSSGFSNTSGTSFGTASGIAGGLNIGGRMPPGASASVRRNANGSYGVSIGGANQGGGSGGGGTPGTPGGGPTGPCLPDLQASGALRFTDSSGNVYAPSSVPVGVALTPTARIRNHGACDTNQSGGYVYQACGGGRSGNCRLIQVNYRTWINNNGNSGGRYPVQLRFAGVGYNHVVNNQGPTPGGGGSNVVTFPTVTFPAVGSIATRIEADDRTTCGANSSSHNVGFATRSTFGQTANPVGCISEEGYVRLGSQASGIGRIGTVGIPNESNNVSNRTVTVVNNATPVGPECSNGSDDGDPEDSLPDDQDPGCHTDGDPTNPGSYDPTDTDETDNPGGLVVNVDLTTDGGATYVPGPGPVGIGISDISNLEIRWSVVSSGTGLDCDGTDDFTQVQNAGAPGQQAPNGSSLPSVGGPTMRYGVTCTDSNGTGSDYIDVRVPPAPSNVALDVRKATQAAWTTNAATVPFVIGVTDDIHLQWSSVGAVSCAASVSNGPGGTGAGSFSTSNALLSNGGGACPSTTGDPNACMDTSIGEPDIGNYAIYDVNCSSPGGTQSAQVEVQRPAPQPILTVINPTTGLPATLVDIGTTVHVSWDANGNDHTQCGLTGPNWTVNDPLPSATGGPTPIVIQGESDFVLSCAANVISPTTGLPVNPASNVTHRVNVTSDILEN